MKRHVKMKKAVKFRGTPGGIPGSKRCKHTEKCKAVNVRLPRTMAAKLEKHAATKGKTFSLLVYESLERVARRI